MDKTISVTSKNILITGNGFDLAHDLPTRYNNFIDFVNFLKLITNFDFDSAKKNLIVINKKKRDFRVFFGIDQLNLKNLFVDEICFLEKNQYEVLSSYKYNAKFEDCVDSLKLEILNQNFINFSGNIININILNYYSKISLNNFFKGINELEKSKKIIKYENIFENEWLDYFVSLKSTNEMQWLDFENEISYILNLIQKFFLRVKDIRIPKNIVDYNLDNENNIDFVSVKNEVDEELLIIFRKIIGDDGRFLPKFLKNSIGKYTYLDCEKIINHIFESFKFFREILKFYFQFIIEKLIDSGVKYDYNFPENDVDFDECYSFNYTSTFNFLDDKIIEKHIHGSCSVYEAPPIILGIDIRNLITEEKNHFFNSFYLFSKQYQTLAYQTSYLHYEELQASKEKIHFYIWGHSLGESDKSYLDIIYDLVSQNINYSAVSLYRCKLIIYYHDEVAKSDYLLKLIKYYGHSKIFQLIRIGRLGFEPAPKITING